MSIYLGIDIGTSGTKTLAIRENGRIVASATFEYPLSSPRPGGPNRTLRTGGRRRPGA